MRRFIVPLWLVLLFVACKSGATKTPSTDTDTSDFPMPTEETLTDGEFQKYQSSLDEIFNKHLLNTHFNGAILVAKNGNILYEKYVGFTNPRQKNTPITNNTSFHLASTSKPFTGMAVLRLVQEGKIHLTDNLQNYFPELPYENVTVKDLLTHRSGLPNYLYFMGDKNKWPVNKMISNEDVLQFLIQHKPGLNYKSGTRFSYCNTNFVLLALIIEKVTGVPYPQYMSETIFEPLGMAHTFVYTPQDSGQVIMSYKPSGAIWELDIFDNTYGDKNIYSTPRDMMKWDAALYNNQFIRQTLIDSAFQPQSHEKPSMHNYGLAWRTLELPNGKKVIYHNGKWHGFTPAFARLLDEKAVIIILGNQFNSNIYQAAKLAYNVFGDYLQNDTAEEEDSTMAAPVKNPPPAKIIQKKRTPPKTTTSKVAPAKKTTTTSAKKTTSTKKTTAQKTSVKKKQA